MTTGQPRDEGPDRPTRADSDRDRGAETPVAPPDEPGRTTGGTETTGTGEGGAGADDTAGEEDAGQAAPERGGRVRPLRRMRRFAAFLVRSRRGLLLLMLMIGGAGAMVMLGGVVAADYSETPAFCGRCHTMDPELKAFNASAHREVACAECHVEPGIKGTVKAKIKGTKQLIEVMTGTFPKPIPPPDHTELPAVKDTCLRCHSLERITSNEGPVGLVLRPTYRTDEENTRELVAVVLRPLGLGGESGVQGVHWHVQQKVTFASTEPQSRTIGLVEITRPDGRVEQYISSSDVTLSSDVRPDISRLKSNERVRTMDCLDCHNRVGHSVPSVDQALDKALASGRIATDLPYIKKAAKALLDDTYPSASAADRAIDGLRDTYRTQYPTAAYDDVKLAQAVDEIKRIYSTLATPQMKVAATTYPDNLGHQEGAGCFRCHDGAHYKVVNGKVSPETIPSKCSTCHTFPQIGGSISVVPLAGQPASHSDRLYVFTHKNTATSSDPSSQSCGACHDKSYCQNCHDSGVAKVTHDEMLYSHAAVIRRVGGPACAYCHQAIYCATCHSGPVLQTKPG
jgi:nitrate/TMAO reductase-like tetraheme cytochrome c subunit